jgi:hypothetical protein
MNPCRHDFITQYWKLDVAAQTHTLLCIRRRSKSVYLHVDKKGMMSDGQSPISLPGVKFLPDVVVPEFTAGWGEDSDGDGLPDKHHLVTLCHIVSLVECCHRTVNPSASALTIRPASECGVTSVGLVLVFTVSIKSPFFTSHVPVRWYVFVRTGWLNHDSSTKLPSAETVFVHRILCGIPTPCGRSSSSRNQTPANRSRKASSLALEISA